MQQFLLTALVLAGQPALPIEPLAGLRGCLERAGDLNGDGYGDLWVAGRADDAGKLPLPGHLWALSGLDGSVLVHVHRKRAGLRFGRSLASIGDVNGDGVPDLAIGCGDPLGGKGSVELLSGKDGHTLRVIESPVGLKFFGFDLDGGQDLNGDGVPDIAIGAPTKNPYLGAGSERNEGRTYLVSGATGEFLPGGLLPSGSRADYFARGGGVGILPDLDRDGVRELAAGDTVYSIRLGTELFSMTPGGWGVGDLGDVNEDGIPDLFLSAVNEEFTIRSGKDGEVLHKINYRGGYYHGDALSADSLGDVDGDGAPDVAIGSNESPYFDNPPDAGRGIVVSGRTRKALFSKVAGESDGIDVSGIGDANGDGFCDLALYHRKVPFIEVYSSQGWKLLWRVEMASLLE